MKAWLGPILIGALTLTGCGTVGSPVPPETIGVKARLDRDKAQAAKQAAQAPVAPAATAQPPQPEQPAEPESAAGSMQIREPAGPEESISSKPTGDAMIRSR